MAGWCFENNLPQSWKPLRTYEIRTFDQHIVISRSCKWTRPVSHRIVYYRRVHWVSAIIILFCCLFLSCHTSLGGNRSIFLICSSAEASRKNILNFLLLLASMSGCSQISWKWKPGSQGCHLSLSVSQRLLPTHHCICGQYRKEVTMGGDDLGICRLDFWPWGTCRLFQNQSERRNPHCLHCRFLTEEQVSVRLVLRIPFCFLLWVPGYWGAHLHQNPPCRPFLCVILGIKGALGFWKWSNNNHCPLSFFSFIIFFFGCQTKHWVVQWRLYACLFVSVFTVVSLISKLLTLCCYEACFQCLVPAMCLGLAYPLSSWLPGSSKKGSLPCYWFVGHISHVRVIYNERSQASCICLLGLAQGYCTARLSSFWSKEMFFSPLGADWPESCVAKGAASGSGGRGCDGLSFFNPLLLLSEKWGQWVNGICHLAFTRMR